jgi:hypothetical protein
MNRQPLVWWQLAVPICVVVAVIAVGTYLEGNSTGRWRDLRDTPRLAEMAANMENIPLKFGEWEGTRIEDDEIARIQYEKAKVRAHADILFRHRRITGKEVRVSLVCAHHRSIARHTPDKCYVGAGFDVHDAERQDYVTTPVGEVKVRTAQFIRQDQTSRQNQRIVWCFSDNGDWIAPESGRFGLAGSDAWYKLYVMTSIHGSKRAIDIQDSQDFLRDFIPALNKALFPEKYGDSSEGGNGS